MRVDHHTDASIFLNWRIFIPSYLFILIFHVLRHAFMRSFQICFILSDFDTFAATFFFSIRHKSWSHIQINDSKWIKSNWSSAHTIQIKRPLFIKLWRVWVNLFNKNKLKICRYGNWLNDVRLMIVEDEEKLLYCYLRI